MTVRAADPHIAAVVPAYNASATLRECIDSLIATNHVAPDAVIVVDNGSSDDTVAIATSAGVKVAHCAQRGPAAVRNVGMDLVRDSSPEYLLFLDSDACLDLGWIDGGVEFLRSHPEHAAVAGLARSYGNTLAERALDTSLWGLSTRQREPVDVDSLATMAALFRWELVADRRFDCRLVTGEDPDFAFSIRDQGWRLAVSPSLTLVHHNPDRVWAVWRKWYSYGRSYPVAYLRYPQRQGNGFRARMMASPLLLAIVTGASVLGGPQAGLLAFVAVGVMLTAGVSLRFLVSGACGPADVIPVAFVHVGKLVAHQMGIWLGFADWWRLRHRTRGEQCAS